MGTFTAARTVSRAVGADTTSGEDTLILDMGRSFRVVRECFEWRT